MEVNHNFFAFFQIARSTGYSSFDLFSLEMIHEHGYSVSLFGTLNWFSKHFHRFDLAFLLQFAKFNLLSRLYSALYNSTSDDCTFSFDLEAVINQVEKLVIDMSLWKGDLI